MVAASKGVWGLRTPRAPLRKTAPRRLRLAASSRGLHLPPHPGACRRTRGFAWPLLRGCLLDYVCTPLAVWMVHRAFAWLLRTVLARQLDPRVRTTFVLLGVTAGTVSICLILDNDRRNVSRELWPTQNVSSAFAPRTSCPPIALDELGGSSR